MITNITPDLYFTVILSSSKFEWNQCIPSVLLSRNEKCDDDTDTAASAYVDGQHEPYVSAML